MRLHSYPRSSTSYRLRIGLNLKGLDYEIVPIDLLKGEHRLPAFVARNAFVGVPMLEADGMDRTQSIAILEWLEDAYPSPPLLPASPDERYIVREFVSAIATELHAPLNLRTLRFLEERFDRPRKDVKLWYHHWLAMVLGGVEQRLERLDNHALWGPFRFGRPGMFEVVLVPQLYNARRWNFDLSSYPHMLGIEAACLTLPEFERAHPNNQPDIAQGHNR